MSENRSTAVIIAKSDILLGATDPGPAKSKFHSNKNKFRSVGGNALRIKKEWISCTRQTESADPQEGRYHRNFTIRLTETFN